MMKLFRVLVVGLLVLPMMSSCSREGEEITKRESVYLLHRVGVTPVNGMATFTELAPGKIQIIIDMKNTREGLPFPAHLHFGDISTKGQLAYRLNDVEGKTGRSVTILDNIALTDGQPFTYDFLQEMNGSVKIHLNNSYFRNIAIASGNIGKNNNLSLDGIAACTGH